MVNSSWTEKHIHDLWDVAFRVHRVYPPCEVSHLKTLQHIDTDKIIIMSVGQFRPEKDHPLQLQAMFELRSLLSKNEDLWNKVSLFRIDLVGIVYVIVYRQNQFYYKGEGVTNTFCAECL